MNFGKLALTDLKECVFFLRRRVAAWPLATTEDTPEHKGWRGWRGKRDIGNFVVAAEYKVGRLKVESLKLLTL